MRAKGGSSSETAGPQSADGLLAASLVGRRGTVVLICGEQGFSVHWARRGGRLFEPSGDALHTEDVIAGSQLDGRFHFAIADGAYIGGVLHWYQTSSEKFDTSRERHVRSWAVGICVVLVASRVSGLARTKVSDFC